MEVKLRHKIDAQSAAIAASKSRGTKLPIKRVDRAAFVSKWAPKHRNVAEHMVYAIDISGVTRAAFEIIGETRFGFTLTEMSQRYREAGDFAWPHKYNRTAKRVYGQLLDKHGWKKEDARYVLPVTSATEGYVTANRVAWMDIVRRLYGMKQYDMIEVADRVKEILLQDIYSDKALMEEDPQIITQDHLIQERLVQQDDGPLDFMWTGFLTVRDKLSIAAYQQIKRHRTATVMVQGRIEKDEFYMPDYDTGLDIYDKAMKSDPIAKNGSMRWFFWQMPAEGLYNFFRERTGNHAQKEIRDWAKSLESELYS